MADKKADIWMPLWIGAYLGDTMRLTTIQHGAYMLLLIAYWRDRKPLPDDDEELRAITKTDKQEWKRLRPKLEGFFRVQDGAWWHKRVEAEMLEADKRANSASDKAKAAAQARWGKSKSNAPSIPQASLEQCPTPSPTPISNTSPDGEGQSAQDSCPQQAIVSLFKDRCPTARHPRLWSPARQALLRARWKEDESRQSLDWWRRFFDFVNASDFLMGRTHSKDRRPFELSLEWLCKSENFLKVLEGAYDNR